MNPILVGNGLVGDSKEHIVRILGESWPLSIRRIYHILKKQYNYSASYHAAYKSIQLLVDRGIVVKNGRQYQLDSRWVREARNFVIRIDDNYNTSGQGVTQNLQTEILNFSSLKEMDLFWMARQREYMQSVTSQAQQTCWHGNHCWWLLVYPNEEYSLNKLIKEKKVGHYMLCNQDTKLDLWAEAFYRKIGINFKIYHDTSLQSDISIMGDLIMQVYLPPAIKRKIASVFKNAKTLSDVDIPAFIDDIVEKKQDIKLLITKNHDLARQLCLHVVNKFT